MEQLTKEDIKNILNLITRVGNITGQEALAVAVLQQKLVALLPKEEKIIATEAETSTGIDTE